MKKLNEKGLTLIELLVVIVIIVIISLLVIPSVINMLGKNKNEKYKNYENLLVENMKLYRIDNSENLGDNIDTHLSLNILKSANPDIKLDNCVVHDLYIKNSEYNVCLRCGYDEETKKYEYESTYCETGNIPYGKSPTTTTLVKSVKTTPASGYLNDGNDIKIEVVLSRQVTGTNPTLTILAGNNNKTLTGVLEGNKLVYNYTVKNGDNGKFNDVSLNGGSLKDIENNEEANLDLPDVSSSLVLDTIEPTCNITLTNKRIENKLEKVDLKVIGADTNLGTNSYSFDNSTYNNVSSKTITIDDNYKAYVKDLANNIGMCSKLVYIDRENPTITTTVVKGEGTATVNVTLKDNEGVIKYQEHQQDTYNSNWITIPSTKEKALTLTKTKVGTYYVYAYDEYGHITKVSYEIKSTDLDNEKPVLTVSNKICTGKSCIIKIKMTDNIGIVSYNDGSSWINVNPAVKEKELTLTKTSVGTYKVQAKDDVGNIGEVSFEILNSDFDTTPPVITFTIDSTHTIATATCTDPETGIVGDASKTQNLSGTSNVNVTFTCTNGAGLTTTETKTYKYSTCALGENTCQGKNYNCDNCYYGENTCKSKYICTKYSCPSGYSASGSSCKKTVNSYLSSYTNSSECSKLCSREYGSNTYCSGAACYGRTTYTASKECSAGYTDSCYSGSNTCSYGCDYDSCYTGHNTCKVGWTL